LKIIFANCISQKDVYEQINSLTGCGAQISDIYVLFDKKRSIIHYTLPTEITQEEFGIKLSGTILYEDIILVKG
jgi:hypothetical protein